MTSWETILKSLIRRSGWRSQTSISCYLCRSLVGRIWLKSQWRRPAVWQHNKEGIIPSMFFNFMVKADSVKVLDEKSARHWKRRRIEAVGDPWIDSIRWRVQPFKTQCPETSPEESLVILLQTLWNCQHEIRSAVNDCCLIGQKQKACQIGQLGLFNKILY